MSKVEQKIRELSKKAPWNHNYDNKRSKIFNRKQ